MFTKSVAQFVMLNQEDRQMALELCDDEHLEVIVRGVVDEMAENKLEIHLRLDILKQMMDELAKRLGITNAPVSSKK